MAWQVSGVVSTVVLAIGAMVFFWRRRLGRKSLPSVQTISASTLATMLVAACEALEKRRSYVDKINVYPVADGDTGANMVHTMRGIKTVVSERGIASFSSIKTLSEVVKEAAMLNARGNSGIILCEYWQGLFGTWEEAETIDSRQLTHGLRQASRLVRQNLDNPVDGTILDVFEGLARSAEKEAKRTDDLVEILRAGIESARDALERTRGILPEMRSAKVVDAGGAGFLYILGGMLSGLKGQVVHLSEMGTPDHLVLQEEKTLTYRYCTEGILHSPQKDIRELKRLLNLFGDSMHVVSTSDKTKFHLHCNDPQALKAELAAFGTITDWKEEDMVQMQQEHLARHFAPRTKMPWALVVDSSLDRPEGWTVDVPFFQVPLAVFDANHPEHNLGSLPVAAFYDRMEGERGFVPKTSQPSPEACRTTFSEALAIADNVLVLSLSAKLSSTFANMQKAARDLAPERIHCLDSQTTSAGLTLLAERIAPVLDRGKAVSQVVAEVAALRERIKVLFLVDNLKYLSRGGRIGKVQSWVGQLLRAQPLLSIVGGEVKPTGDKLLFASEEKQFALLSAKVAADLPQRIVILHANRAEKAQRLGTHLQSSVDSVQEVAICPLNPVLGAHAGPGTLGVGYERKANSK